MTPFVRVFRATAFRLTLAILGLSAIGAAIVLGAVAWQVMSVVDEETRQTIESEVSRLSDQYEQGGLAALDALIEMRSREPGSSLYLLTNNAGLPLAGNISSLPDGVLARPGYVYTPYEIADGDPPRRMALARIFVLPNGFRLLVGHDLSDRARIGAVMLRALATSLIFLAILAGLGALFVTRRVLSRIDAMSGSARAIMAGDLDRRLPVSGAGDELDRLAQSLNEMLQRIGALMAGLREVSDNVAHDLRTPLTRLRNHAELALRSGQDPAALRAAIEKMIEESDSLIKVFDSLLLIARAEAGADRAHMKAFDLAEALAGVTELYEPVAEEKGAKLSLNVSPGLALFGNRELIGQAIANLIDNALKYAAPEAGVGHDPSRAEISISAERVGASIVIAVADRGPGVAPEDRTRALDRFVRLEGARTRPGSGLGLSMTSAVARLHGGEVRLEDNAPGLKVLMILPAGTPAALPRAIAAQ